MTHNSMMMACSRKNVPKSWIVAQLSVSALEWILWSFVVNVNPLLSLTDRTNFALPGYDGISFRAAFSLSLNVEPGERDFRALTILRIWSPLSSSSSTLSEWTGLIEGITEATKVSRMIKLFLDVDYSLSLSGANGVPLKPIQWNVMVSSFHCSSAYKSARFISGLKYSKTKLTFQFSIVE